MNLLVLDTSTKKGVAALHKSDGLWKKKEFDSLEQQKILIDTIDSLFQEAEIRLEDLDAVAVCVGPGSFTGTRIGVMTAKTFGYGANIPLIPFNSLLPYHKPGALTIRNTKQGYYYVFDGKTLEKVPPELLDQTKPHIFPHEGVELPYSFESILSLPKSEQIVLLY